MSTHGKLLHEPYIARLAFKRAMKIAHKYIRKYYGSHQSSRRLHYELKKQGYLKYYYKVYNAEIIYYEDRDLGIKLWNNNMKEVIYGENIASPSSKEGNQTGLPLRTRLRTQRRNIFPLGQ